MELWQGDSLELMRRIPDASVDLVIADPPYNVGVCTGVNGRKIKNKWDVIANYDNWMMQWIQESQRVLKPTGVLYFWHNNMPEIARLMTRIQDETELAFVSFCIWDKGDGYRAQSWHNRRPGGKSAPRSWFNVCEYLLHYFNGGEAITSNPESYKPLKDWYRDTKERLGITDKDIAERYTEVTGKRPYMLRHYFQNSQFEIPTPDVWAAVYEPMGFGQYEDLRRQYKDLRRQYKDLRPVHNVDPMHCNIWHHKPIPSNNRLHTCQKPVDLLARLIRVSSRPGAVVLDPFMGSGSTGVAALQEGRDFIGIELDPEYFETARRRIDGAKGGGLLPLTGMETAPEDGTAAGSLSMSALPESGQD